jgi:hypothetical protein
MADDKSDVLRNLTKTFLQSFVINTAVEKSVCMWIPKLKLFLL